MKKIFKKSAKFSLKGIDLTQYILTSVISEEESRLSIFLGGVLRRVFPPPQIKLDPEIP